MIYLTSGSLIPFALLLMFGVMQYVKTEKVLKWIFFTQTITAVGIILLSLVGVIENLGYPTFLRGIRYSFGYIFPLELHVHFLILSLMYLYLYPKQHGWKSFLGISVLNFVLYHFTIARTSFYSGRVCSHNEFDYRLAAFKIQGLPLSMEILALSYTRLNRVCFSVLYLSVSGI